MLEMPGGMAAGAVDGDIYLGLLEVVLAIIVPNCTRIRMGVVVTRGEPVVFQTRGGGKRG